MENTISEIGENEDPIKAILFGPDFEDNGYFVGQCGITEIRAYYESGHMASISWLAVFKGERVLARISAAHCLIAYDTEKEQQEGQ